MGLKQNKWQTCLCIPEIDLKSNTKKILLNEAEEKQCKKGEHLSQSWEKVCFWPDGGVEYNGLKSKKINWINKDEKCQATEVSGKSFHHHKKKKSLDLSILNVNIRWPANKFLIGLLYTNISQMESATDGEETPELKCHCLSPYVSHSALVPFQMFLHL